MSPEVASTILQFMQRVDLKGSEVDAFNQCKAELSKIVEPAIKALQEQQLQAAAEAEIEDGVIEAEEAA